jgi:thioredoxin reductase
MTARLHADVVVVGGGPAGLTAAAALARTHRVLVLDREQQAGGIPRHSDHPGYGMRDLRRVLSGPEYARRLVGAAQDAGAEVRTGWTVTGWSGERSLDVTSPQGRLTVTGGAVVLATGARERGRPARLIAGDRPGGVLTTGQLQQLVHLQHRSPGSRAVVVGSELVSWSAVLTLREAGCRTVLMTTERPYGEAYAGLRIPVSAGLRVPLLTSARVARIVGRDQVEAVELEEVGSGRRRLVECDVVVLTGGWIPDHELVRLGGLELDPATLGPRVDAALRTSSDGVFAAGNVVHPVDTADVCALDGRHVATSVRRWLEAPLPRSAGVELTAQPPLRWVAPSVWRPGETGPARGRMLLWPEERVLAPVLVAVQAGREVGRVRLPWPAVPGRVLRAPSSLVSGVRADAGAVRIALG